MRFLINISPNLYYKSKLIRKLEETLKQSPQKLERKNYLRFIFLNLLIIAFIIISYVYISEPFGSISSFFINNQEFSVQFGITLLIFTFFSILAGPIHGLISGFLGELFFQLAFYDALYLEWCFIVGILGLLSGIYKYRPLKYYDPLKVYYTFIALIIVSCIIFGLIMVIQYFFYPGQISADVIIINYGFKFFLQALISIIFLVPILLLIYDRILSKEERHLYYIILTHHPLSARDHTFYLKFGRTKIYFCSRCSGVIIGGVIALFSTYLTYKIYHVEFSAELSLLFCLILPLPGLIDWGTQRLLLRKSSTSSRLFTGFIIGLAFHFMSFTYPYYYYTLLILIVYFTIFGVMIFLGHKKELKLLEEELDNFPQEVE
ncbi:MAG: DUF2085 domain-containing protein [Candidatus Lokiarchaeota archaeon]|nr:DUF2085 domain-containing protein [Candidatus Lokiarchaeota archaeon]